MALKYKYTHIKFFHECNLLISLFSLFIIFQKYSSIKNYIKQHRFWKSDSIQKQIYRKLLNPSIKVEFAIITCKNKKKALKLISKTLQFQQQNNTRYICCDLKYMKKQRSQFIQIQQSQNLEFSELNNSIIVYGFSNFLKLVKTSNFLYIVGNYNTIHLVRCQSVVKILGMNNELRLFNSECLLSIFGDSNMVIVQPNQEEQNSHKKQTKSLQNIFNIGRNNYISADPRILQRIHHAQNKNTHQPSSKQIFNTAHQLQSIQIQKGQENIQNIQIQENQTNKQRVIIEISEDNSPAHEQDSIIQIPSSSSSQLQEQEISGSSSFQFVPYLPETQLTDRYLTYTYNRQYYRQDSGLQSQNEARVDQYQYNNGLQDSQDISKFDY